MKNKLPHVVLSLVALSLAGCLKERQPAATPPAPADSPAKAHALAAKFDGLLVDAAGKPASVESIAKARYVAVYFSAHWCPPCRAFTPKLVEFTNTHRKDGNFDVIFVSSDRDAASMYGYMTETKMPWNGILNRDGKVPAGIGDGITGIPHLRVFDATGKIVVDTDYDNQVYPATVLEKIKDLIASPAK